MCERVGASACLHTHQTLARAQIHKPFWETGQKEWEGSKEDEVEKFLLRLMEHSLLRPHACLLDHRMTDVEHNMLQNLPSCHRTRM